MLTVPGTRYAERSHWVLPSFESFPAMLPHDVREPSCHFIYA